MTKVSIRYSRLRILIATPYFPSEKELFKSGRPWIRSKAMDPMDIMHEDNRAVVPRAVS